MTTLFIRNGLFVTTETVTYPEKNYSYKIEPQPIVEVEWIIKPMPREGKEVYFECRTKCGKYYCRFTTYKKYGGNQRRRIWMGGWIMQKGIHIADYRKAIRQVEIFNSLTSKLTRSINKR